MKRIILFSIAAVLATAAAAQQYKWVDKDGRTQYGDFPPPGVKATPLRVPAGPAAPAAKSDGKPAAKAAPKGPATPGEAETEFRKRQLEASKEREKQEAADQQAAAKKQNCTLAQENVRQLESGQRIAHMNAQGERYFIDDDQRAQQLVAARKSVTEWCN